MIASLQLGAHRYQLDLAKGHVVSIPLDPHGPQPNSYGVPKAQAEAYAGEGWVGDTRQGGSCNFERLSLITHCNGTHTECLGHITNERLPVVDVVPRAPVPGRLVSVQPVPAPQTSETYMPSPAAGDLLITRAALQAAWEQAALALPAAERAAFTQALVLRTLPNPLAKMAYDYTQQPSPFFSHEAMAWLVAQGVQHLLVDMPSVDRLLDDGLLTNHRTYWGMPAAGTTAAHTAAAAQRPAATITEFIYAGDAVADGVYFVSVQLPWLLAEAAPSTIVLHELLP